MSPLLLIIILPLFAALFSYIVRKQSDWVEGIAIASGLGSFLLASYLFSIAATGGLAGASRLTLLPYFALDPLGTLILGASALVYACAALYLTGALRIEIASGFASAPRRFLLFVMLHLFAAALFAATMAANPILFWIALEATTLATVLSITFYKVPASTEAAWKYLILSSLGLLLSFLGTLLFLLAAQGKVEGIATWNDLTRLASSLSPELIKLAGVLVFIGFGTKLGLVPMHTWKPDAYSRAPIAIVALFSTGVLNVSLLALLRFKVIVDTALGVGFMHELFLFFGTLSLVVSALIMLTQTKFRRLFAYSSVEHAGIMCLGIGFGGIAAFGAILHMLYHTLAKSLIFFTSGVVQMKYHTHRIKNIRGALDILPKTSVLFAIGVLAAVALPPFGLFTSELYIFGAGFGEHRTLSVIALSAIGLIFVAMLWKLHQMLFGEPITNPRLASALGDPPASELHGEALRERMRGEPSTWTLVPAIVLAVLLIVSGIYLPGAITDLIGNAATLIQ